MTFKEQRVLVDILNARMDPGPTEAPAHQIVQTPHGKITKTRQ